MNEYNKGRRDGIKSVLMYLSIIAVAAVAMIVGGTAYDNKLGKEIDFEGTIDSFRADGERCYAKLDGKEYLISQPIYKISQLGDYLIVYRNGECSINGTRYDTRNTFF